MLSYFLLKKYSGVVYSVQTSLFLRLSVPISLHFVRGKSWGGKCNIFYKSFISQSITSVYIYTPWAYTGNHPGGLIFSLPGVSELFQVESRNTPMKTTYLTDPRGWGACVCIKCLLFERKFDIQIKSKWYWRLWELVFVHFFVTF